MRSHDCILQLSAHSPGRQLRGNGDTRASPGLGLFGISTFDSQPVSSWFASVKTWEVRYPAALNENTFSVVDMKRHTKTIQGWLVEWVEKGSNPFIHSRLYQTRFPRSVQDAYSALTCYFHKTASNEHIIFKLIEDRVMHLIAEHNVPSANQLQKTNGVSLNSIDHIARVQALLVYQIIGLYDGDIRLRHISETHMPILNTWMWEMVQHASQAACLGGAVISSTFEPAAVGPCYPLNAQSENLLWDSWILAECVRRTWVVSSAIHTVFLALQNRETSACQGGMMFTTREGVWEAKSAVAWEKICAEVNVGLMQMAEADKLFTEAAPEEINEFTKVILDAVFGREKMERWGVRIEY